jgi:hypothetical protein
MYLLIATVKRTLKNADWKPFLNSHKSRATTPWKYYTFAFEPDNDFVLCTDTQRQILYVCKFTVQKPNS